MKKILLPLAVVGLVLTIALAIGWQNRIELVVWGAPKLRAAFNPIPPNVATNWQMGPAKAEQAAVERPPNIILILADDMGFNDVSLYNGGAGDGDLKTPNIDSIAQEGVRFNNGYAANAVCAPSRATILTGRYSTRFGFEFTPFFKLGATIFQWMQDIEQPSMPTYIDAEKAAAMPEMRELGMPPEQITIAEVLKAAGYYTAHIGKWHLGGTNGMRPEDQGFDDSLYMAGTLYMPEDDPNIVNAKYPENNIDRMVWATGQYSAQFNGSEPFQPGGYLTDYYTNEAIKVIEKNKNRPFFLYLAHWGIHNPLQALKSDYDALSHIADHNLRTYSAMIQALDRGVGRVIQTLENNGLTDNTLIVFTSDNGGAGYIDLENINKPFRGWKLTHFEGGTHVPFMAKWPAKITAGSLMNDPVHHVDLFETFSAAAGAGSPTDRKMDGVDLLPHIRQEAASKPHETLFWREGHQQAVLHSGWKMIRADRPDKRWLFNLAIDPTEQTNLAQANPAKLAELEQLLAQHNAEQAEPLWPSIIDGPQQIDKTSDQPFEPGDEYIYWPN